ncbi:unnamed protein product [Ascophyllum nodosum]
MGSVILTTFRLAGTAGLVLSMRIPRPWRDDFSACEMVRDPNWPFVYSKHRDQKVERNGRVNTNLQDERHQCGRRGVRSKCHLCEDIACGDSLDSTCSYQLQGVNASLLATNIPAVSDTPWAVGGGHRNDFGNASVSRVCVMLSGGSCLEPFGDSYSNCTVRCWGSGFSGADANPVHNLEALSADVKGNSDFFPTVAWEYPKALTASFGPKRETPSFNPQGYVFTLAGGSGVAGFADGNGSAALFNGPQDVAVDADANVYVADTGNHRIRRITPEGEVTTVAGDGREDSDDGVAAEASFSFPGGIALHYDATGGLVLYVADTNNHRVRKISGDVANGAGIVTCHAGRCGNATESWVRMASRATPEAGLADGDGSLARFDGPSGLAAAEDGTLFVADTNNHVIRMVLPDSTVFTLAGTVMSAEPKSTGIESCPSPCLRGVAGHDLVGSWCPFTRFNHPADVSLGPNGTLFVVDLHSLRRVSMPEHPTTVLGVGFDGRVTTVAGGAGPGETDGTGPEARFSLPSGVASTADGAAYLSDAASCRLRRVAPTVSFASAMATCSTTLAEALRPSGCSSYSPPQGGDGLIASPLSGNVWYNHWRNVTKFLTEGTTYEWSASARADAVAAETSAAAVDVNGDYSYAEDPELVRGRVIRQCIGFPPPSSLDRAADPFNALVVDDGLEATPEDTEVHTTVRISCPTSCLSAAAQGHVTGRVRGSPNFYTDDSAVCMAAVHAGVLSVEAVASAASPVPPLASTRWLSPSSGQLVMDSDESDTVIVVVARILPSNASEAAPPADYSGSSANGISSAGAPKDWRRGFALELAFPSEVTTQTISGRPVGALGKGCGEAVDGQPPQEAVFGRLGGVDAWRASNLTDEVFLYIADAGNHAVRAASAVCSFVCENGGSCQGPDSCSCTPGWAGHDCSLPTCADGLCSPRQVCVGPGECGCIPGYTGTPHCLDALCVQPCEHGGSCTAPDTCACADGWFGPNCTVPVCPQTCGNGGNCTAPGTCTCPSEWAGGGGTVAGDDIRGADEGDDCRIPVCAKECLNGGWCVAPETCACPPQWTGYDCAMPVCTQGYFAPGYNASGFDPDGRPFWQKRYVPCDVLGWCNATSGFDCSQPARSSEPVAVGWDAYFRDKTGRSENPNRCMMIELEKDVVSPFSYLRADNGSTAFARYSPSHPYEWSASPPNPWSAYNDIAPGKTGPFLWSEDRQVALVEYHNVTEGRYKCANGGNCTSPGVCECAAGWSGFDCRTPICSQGYYDPTQTRFVSGNEGLDDMDVFKPFLDQNLSASYKLTWPYSNPNYSVHWERFENKSHAASYISTEGNTRYLALSQWSQYGSNRAFTPQGGYSCSVRAWTEHENEKLVLNSPNYYSRYMDAKVEADGERYTSWKNMHWPPLHTKSARLELTDDGGNFFVYTDTGYMRGGIWRTTGEAWQKGVCVVQFNRICPVAKKQAIDLESVALGKSGAGVLVQDTDLSYRARVRYSVWREEGSGWWEAEGGECVDHVLRGCYNNGTCVAPDICACAEGWTGHDCSIPVCPIPCQHNGNCTLPGVCSCARGWTGEYCTQPMCAQDCNNHGECVAPDVCMCTRWDSDFRDGREGGGIPLFQTPNGDTQQTGWTGYDCSVPICVQAERFVLNVEGETSSGFAPLKGHGFDGMLACGLVRCPKYDYTYITNLGTSFQTGCGNDPLDTGCCYFDSSSWTCEYCEEFEQLEHRQGRQGYSFECIGSMSSEVYTDVDDIPLRFIKEDGEVALCGPNLSPLPPYANIDPMRDDWIYSSHSLLSNVTSGRYLCGRLEWGQGDFYDDAGFGPRAGFGVHFGLPVGRHIRYNYKNYTKVDDDTWVQGVVRPGEGVYRCHNGGSCLAPDTCSCPDGWDGFDCNTPLCRQEVEHLQPSGLVSSCQNGGICSEKDSCTCVTADSVLWQVYEGATRDLTGWTGTDCSMPICVQGFFDPFCTDLPQAPGGEGCFRCPNGGVCSAPDHCDCAEGWTEYDCTTPICEVVADDLLRLQLNTMDEERVASFESDPCKMTDRYAPVEHEGALYYRGNCTAPNQCTCMCWEAFDVDDCKTFQTNCDGPWQECSAGYLCFRDAAVLERVRGNSVGRGPVLDLPLQHLRAKLGAEELYSVDYRERVHCVLRLRHLLLHASTAEAEESGGQDEETEVSTQLGKDAAAATTRFCASGLAAVMAHGPTPLYL